MEDKFKIHGYVKVLIGLKHNYNATRISKEYDITFSQVSNIIDRMKRMKMIESCSLDKRRKHYILTPQAYTLAKHLVCAKSIMQENKWL